MQLFIKTLTGKTIVIDLEPGELVIELKQKILDKEGIPTEKQKLICCNRELTNKFVRVCFFSHNSEELTSSFLRLEPTIHLVLVFQQHFTFLFEGEDVKVSGYERPPTFIIPQLEEKTKVPREFMQFLDTTTGVVRSSPERLCTFSTRHQLLDSRKDNTEAINKIEEQIKCEQEKNRLLTFIEDFIASDNPTGLRSALKEMEKYDRTPTTRGALISYDGDFRGTQLYLSEGSSLLHLALWKNAKQSLKVLLLSGNYPNPREARGSWLEYRQDSLHGDLWSLASWMSEKKYYGTPDYVCRRQDFIQYLEELLMTPDKVILLIPRLGKDVLTHVFRFLYELVE